MVNRGVFMTPGDEEQWTISVQHTDADIDRYVECLRRVLRGRLGLTQRPSAGHDPGMSLSPYDDYPIHQTAEVLRHPATSDRNFYDRYYFMLHDSTGDLMMIMGLGQYPNLSVQDAFGLVRRGTMHRVVRASRELGADRMDTSVGPFRIEVLEGLQRVRFVLEPNEHGLAFDVTFTAAAPAVLEPRHFIRQYERAVFDTQRFAQTGFWAGSITIGDEVVDVSGDNWQRHARSVVGRAPRR